MIYFEEKSHTYRLDDPINGPLCISATTFLGLFKQDYDSEFWSYYTGLRKALGYSSPIKEIDDLEKKRFSKYLIVKFKYNFGTVKISTTQENKDRITEIAYMCGVPQDQLEFYQNIAKAEWRLKNDKSKTKGTGFHNFKEGEIYSDLGLEYDGIFARVIEDPNDLSLLHNLDAVVIAPELKMYNRQYRISGTADKVFIYPSKKFDIDDWKTNEKIDMSNKYDKMKYPLHRLDDCNHNHYCIQVSLYAWMLEQWGYKPNSLKFTHVEIDDQNNILNRVEYHTPYLKQDIENMLNYFDQNREILINKALQKK